MTRTITLAGKEVIVADLVRICRNRVTYCDHVRHGIGRKPWVSLCVYVAFVPVCIVSLIAYAADYDGWWVLYMAALSTLYGYWAGDEWWKRRVWDTRRADADRDCHEARLVLQHAERLEAAP